MTIESNGGHVATNTQQATGLHLRQLINLLRRRWKLIIIAVGIAIGLAGAIGLVFPPRYTATAQIIVDPPTMLTSHQRSLRTGELPSRPA